MPDLDPVPICPRCDHYGPTHEGRCASCGAASAATLIAPQPAPLHASGDVWSEVIADLPEGHILRPLCEARRLFGIEKYGTPVQRANGRNHLVDALQEALDLMVYLRAADGPGQHRARGIATAIAEDLAGEVIRG